MNIHLNFILILFYLVSFHFILFYFTLFYFILFLLQQKSLGLPKPLLLPSSKPKLRLNPKQIEKNKKNQLLVTWFRSITSGTFAR